MNNKWAKWSKIEKYLTAGEIIKNIKKFERVETVNLFEQKVQ